jgi:Na+/H+ antiporter NhaD/arsenite permease-like protein
MLDAYSLSELLKPYLEPRLVSNLEFLLLFLLMMLVMNALGVSGLLSSLGRKIVNKAGTERKLAHMLCLLVFFTAALVTNDVALLGIVPLTIMVGVISRVDVIKLGIFEGIAANSGSLLTPFGNPQNIFISIAYNVPLGEFLWGMLPLWLASLGLLVLFVHFQFGNKKLHHVKEKGVHRDSAMLGMAALCVIILYFGRVLPTVIVAPVVVILLIATRKTRIIWKKFDLKLYMVFVLMAFVTYLALKVYTLRLEGGPLFFGSIALSQAISNVPATFILSGAADWRILALGVNIGGSGTLISSMATVIAYRLIKKYDEKTSMWAFMKWGALFCIILTAVFAPLTLLAGG